MRNVVILIDNKTRDLDVAALIAHHLSRFDIECHLEPLEAFRGALATYRPEMIIFNLLTASHLVEYSKRLSEMGVLTAVLPNEGILYDEETLRFNAGRNHNEAHIDYFFCWNEAHRKALIAEGFDQNTRVEVVGVPRFDFYFKPWSDLVLRPKTPATSRPRILVCTNFMTAHFCDLPRGEGDKFFGAWAQYIPLYQDYWRGYENHKKGRQRSLDFLEALIRSDRFEITLRPHPMEDANFYRSWIEKLSSAQRAHLHFDTKNGISGLILDCNLEISCETCTTALEAWIANKPTIELIFERDPLWYREIQGKANVPCDNPESLPDLIDQQLRNPISPEMREARKQHLKDWCAVPNGNSSLRIAEVVRDALERKRPADWSKLTFNDYRRAFKLKGKQKMGVAYHFDPMLTIKYALFPRQYNIRNYVQQKSITPSDVSEARKRIENLKA